MGEAKRRLDTTHHAVAAMFQQGVESMQHGDYANAEVCFRRLHHVHLSTNGPDYAVTGMLGQCLMERARAGERALLPQAAEWLAQSYHVNPDASVGIQLGDAYQRMGLNRAAREVFAAIALRPDDAKAKPLIARVMLAGLNAAEGKPGVIEAMRELADADLTDSYAINLRGFARKWLGRWHEGWEDHRNRFTVLGHASFWGGLDRGVVPYLRDANEAIGKTVALWPEQGMGDLVFLTLWLRDLRERHPETRFVFSGTDTQAGLLDAMLMAMGKEPYDRMLAAPDRQCSVLDVPLIFGPAEPPIAEPRHHPIDERVCIKLTGLSSNFNDHDRSCHDIVARAYLAKMLPVAVDLDAIPIAEGWSWWQTMEVIRTQRALITVDTAVANIGAVLGVPTLLIPPTLPEYRWGTHDTRVPWAPSVTLVRRAHRDDWLPTLGRCVRMINE